MTARNQHNSTRNMKLILGSKSPGRKKILTKIGYKFSVMDPDIDEKSIRDKNPKKLVTKLARAKATALLPKIKKPLHSNESSNKLITRLFNLSSKYITTFLKFILTQNSNTC